MEPKSPPEYTERHVRDLDIEGVGVGHPFSYTLEDADTFELDDLVLTFTAFGGRFTFHRVNILWFSLRDDVVRTLVKPHQPPSKV